MSQIIDTAPQTTRTGTWAPIGVDQDEAPVSWRLADQQGRPVHGLVTGWAGAGASVLLSHVVTAAARVGFTTWYLDAKADPAGASWHTGDTEAFMHALEAEAVRQRPAEEATPLLAVVDDPRALQAHTATLQAITTLRPAGVGLVVRATDLFRRHLSPELRAVLAASQYLALDHGAPVQYLAQALPGYTAPARRQGPGRRRACGRGRYGHGGRCRPVTVRFP